ncbi:DUF4083 family protein [Halalkalibacter alkalisediminis]|uniref:DUF4083 family protein n=2 Tax=Halalkalibacter alkalisediminis TaxID=935616 RepID=A0ABV6NLN2_9BACI|nr:DUF4083 family protein [Halalkalibacter alkalisediminis]
MGTAIYQLVAILIPITIIFLVVWFIRSSIRKSKQLKRIEQKLDEIDNSNTKGS